jgi:hypothetical protein
MAMMAATHAAASIAGGFLLLLFFAWVGLYFWGRG